MQRRFQPPFWPSFFSLIMFGVLLGLGFWQVQRLEWKTHLVEQVQSRMEKAAVPMPEKIDDPASWEYRRVTLAGRFLDHEFLVQPRVLNGVSGYHMIVPFQRISGGVVMVNRGWISAEELVKASRPKGMQKLEGIVQLPHNNMFTPQNDPRKNTWYWSDVGAMAAAASVKNVSPVLVNVVGGDKGVYPIGGKVEMKLPNDHRQYAAFWFVMALISQVIFVMRYWVAPAERK